MYYALCIFHACKVYMDNCNPFAGDHCKALEFLCEISTLPRFDTIALFLSDAEKTGKFSVYDDATLAEFMASVR